MASITVRNLDDDLKRRLRIRATENGRSGRSMEQEARDILRSALEQEPSANGDLAGAIRPRYAPLGGVELDFPPREPLREPPQLA